MIRDGTSCPGDQLVLKVNGKYDTTTEGTVGAVMQTIVTRQGFGVTITAIDQVPQVGAGQWFVFQWFKLSGEFEGIPRCGNGTWRHLRLYLFEEI